MGYKEINSLIAKCIRKRNNPKATGKEFREALAKVYKEKGLTLKKNEQF